MRTWGRTTDPLTIDPLTGSGKKTWQLVVTDAAGRDDLVWLTTLCQVLKLAPGESPFYANYGIPAQRSVIQQIFPDYYVTLTQSQFSQYFAALVVANISDYVDPVTRAPAPYYNINVVTQIGVSLSTKVAV